MPNKKHIGLKIGAICTVCSFIMTFTLVVPILAVIPGVIFETISSNIVSNDPYSNVGKMTILLLSIVLALTLALFLFIIRTRVKQQKKISNLRIILIMLACFFIVHPLGFYIYWGHVLNFRSDGQLIFAAVDSFPYSSLAFVIIGALIDGVKNTAAHPL